MSKEKKIETSDVDTMKANKDTAGLIRALSDKDKDIRREAAYALAEVKDASAGPALMRALQDEAGPVRAGAAWALGEINEVRAIPLLVGASMDEDMFVRLQADAALMKIRARGVQTTTLVEQPHSTDSNIEEETGPIEDDKSQSWSLNDLKSEDQALAAELINLGSDDPDVRYKAYNVLDQKRYGDQALLEALSRLETEIPASEVTTRVRLYCGLGTWLGGNIYTRPKGLELIKHAIELAPQMALPHTLLGTLVMGNSSNANLERQSGSLRLFSGMSLEELGLLSQAYHEEAKKELELAINLDPKDAAPYYVFCQSKFLDYRQLENYYLLGIERDKTHSPEFGRYHWSFAIAAAKFDRAGEATKAFLRAMLVEPQEYYEGPRAVRPREGLALSCWQTAKQQVGSYQSDPVKIKALWSVEQAIKPAPPKSTAVVASKTSPIRPAPTPGPSHTIKRAKSPLRWIIILGGILCVCIGVALILSKTQNTTQLPTGVTPSLQPTHITVISTGVTPSLQPTPTKIISTPTPKPVPPTPTISREAPTIHSVTLRPDTSSGSLVIYQDVFFSDAEGDVIRWDFKVVSSTNPNVYAEGGDLDIPAGEQMAGAIATGEWGCGDEKYSVTLSVTLIDRANHRSAPYEYTMECNTGN